MSPLTAAAPQRFPRSAAGEVGFRLPAELRAAGEARRRVRGALASWGVPEETARTVELVVSELVANAVRHTASATVGARLWDRGDVLGVEITDEHAGAEGPSRRAAAEEDECGRGLALVDALTLRWGVVAEGPGTGQRVWAEVPRADWEMDAATGRAPRRPTPSVAPAAPTEQRS
ncbi:ATP-binding protein [Streptomyces sedi]|uniref:ATP-binding protein n=1 Tax=Streptomyces sedi TaxID=555059 RepID=A0A5C4UTN0_9ACTN|nr:ATP-binding protein [Streptomyces sedi]TNM27011.1 ATP-binding protein [Streptomyces sedi]